MKIVFITDAQGNHTAFETVLADAEKQMPDKIIFGGDMINPYAGPGLILDRMRELKYRCLLGNQEDWMLQYHSDAENDLIKKSVRFMPTQNTARKLTADDIAYLKTMPMQLTEGPPDKQVLFCHASPFDLWKSFGYGINAEMEKELAKIKASVIVCGHLHRTFELGWKGKLLVIAGSCGMPLKNRHYAEYLLLEYRNSDWQLCHKSIRYDYESEIRRNLDSDFIEKGGPVSWLMIDELVTQRDHLTSFFQKQKDNGTDHPLPWWEDKVISFLQDCGRWDAVKKLISC